MARYELLEGKHSDEKGRTYRKGDFIETERDLEGSFGKKRFRRIDPGTAASLPQSEVVAPAATAVIDEPKKILIKAKRDDAALAARGTEATDKFEVDSLFQVFRRGGAYHIFEKGGVTALNAKPLSKKEVESFCKKYLEE